MERKGYTRDGGVLGLRELLAMNFSSGGPGPSSATPLAGTGGEAGVHEVSRPTFNAVSPSSHPTMQPGTTRSAIGSSNCARRDACFCFVRQPKLKIDVDVNLVSAPPVGSISKSSDDLNSGEREFSLADELVYNMELRLSIDFLLPGRALNRGTCHGSGTAPGDGEVAPSDAGQPIPSPVLRP